MSRTPWWAGFRPAEVFKRMTVAAVVAMSLPAAHWCTAQVPKQEPNPFRKAEDETKPEVVPPFQLERTLHTIPVPHDRPAFNYQMVDASLQNRDKQGIWVLDFAFKPLRIRTVPFRDQGRTSRSITCTTRSSTARASPGCLSPSS